MESATSTSQLELPPASVPRGIVFQPYVDSKTCPRQLPIKVETGKAVISIAIPPNWTTWVYETRAGVSGGRPLLLQSCPEAVKIQTVRIDGARNMANGRCQSIFAAWTRLKEIFARHENTISKRWLKKTRESRRKLLLEVWPNISVSHRPEFEAVRRQTFKKFDLENETAFLWPQINLEDLSRPQSLLIFLESRAQYPPNTFAKVDEHALEPCRRYKAIPLFLLPNYYMDFGRSNSPDTYGEIIEVPKNNRDEEDVYRSGNILLAGKGLMLLKAQKWIYKFLVRCCERILHDIAPDDLLTGNISVQTSSQASREQNLKYDSPITPLAATAADGVYRPPSDLNLKRMGDLLAAKKSAAEDHLLALREDPAYFAEMIGERKEHSSEFILDSEGHAGPNIWPSLKPTIWGWSTLAVIYDAYIRAECWSDFHAQICSLQRWKDKQANKILTRDAIPEIVLAAFNRFEARLGFVDLFFTEALSGLAPGSPFWRTAFIRARGNLHVTSKLFNPSDKLFCRVYTLMESLVDYTSRAQSNTPVLIEELGRLMENEPQCKEYLTNSLLGVISDIAVVAECQQQLANFEPLASTLNRFREVNDADARKRLAGWTDPWAWLYEEGHPQFQLTGAHSTPVHGRFYYPVDKAKTRENNRLVRDAEDNLRKVWSVIESRPEYVRLLSEEHTHAITLLRDHPPSKTPEWIEPAEVAARKPSEEQDPVSQLTYEFNSQLSIVSEEVQTTPKEKVKTRGIPQPSKSTPSLDVASVEVPSAVTSVRLNKRARKVFLSIFFDPSGEAQPGEIPWSEFLYAMTSIGFAAEKVYGSVWQFSPMPGKLDLSRSIQFHEPHPGNKVRFWVARRFGSRLKRAYGWDRATFVQQNDV